MNGWMVEPEFFVFFWGGVALGESNPFLIDQKCRDQSLKVLKSPVDNWNKSNAWDSRKKCHSYLCNSNISFLVSTLFRDQSCMAAVSTDRGWSQWLDFAVLWQHDACGHTNRRGWSLYRLMSFCLGGLAFCRLVCGQSCVNYESWMIFFAPWAGIKWYHHGGFEHYIHSQFWSLTGGQIYFPKSDGDIVSWVVVFWLWAALWDVVIEIVILRCRRCSLYSVVLPSQARRGTPFLASEPEMSHSEVQRPAFLGDVENLTTDKRYWIEKCIL